MATLPPHILAAYLKDPKALIALQMQKEGTDTSPVQHWTQGLARMAKAGVGSYMANKLKKQYEQEAETTRNERQNAMVLAMGRPAETQTYGDTTINWNPQAPNYMGAVSALQSPDNEALANSLLSAKINQDQLSSQQSFQQQQQERLFGQQKELANMTLGRQQAMQDAMLKRQMEIEKYKYDLDPMNAILRNALAEQAPTMPQPPNMTPIPQALPQTAPQAAPQAPQAGVPSMRDVIFNAALASKGLKAPEGFMMTPQGIVPVTGPGRKISPTEQKELFDTMDLINASQGVQKALSDAQNILDTKDPFTGFGAESLAYANRIPGIGPFINDDRAAATTEMSNAVTEQALNQLKAIFGGMPSEGERQILLSLQALPSYMPQEQKAILQRAQEAVQRRLAFNKLKAQSIQTGDYKTMNLNNLTPPSTDGWSIRQVP